MKEILDESTRDNLLIPYVNMINQNGGNTTVSQLKQYLLAKFVNEANIRNLSLSSNYYLAGVARYYFEGNLTSNRVLNVFNQKQEDVWNREICDRLNALILVLRNHYIDTIGTEFEQPEDFGALPLEKLLKKYNKVINKELGIEDTPKETKPTFKIDRNNKVGNGYTFDIIYSYEEARKYNKATEPGAWCITYGQQHYNAYVRRLNIHYVIFAKDGYENIPRRKGPNWTYKKPQDEYGNSLIALLQSNKDGEPVYITSRWNHGTSKDGTNCEADHAYTKQEFLNIVGIDDATLQRIFKIWENDRKTKNPSLDRKQLSADRLNILRIFKYAQMRINGGDANPFEEYNFRINRVLTNVDRFSQIKNEVWNNTDSTKSESLKKQYNRIIKDSIRICEVIINDTPYYFLMDKNRILFDTIVKQDSPYDLPINHFYSSEDEYTTPAKNLTNIIRCDVVNGIMLYNTKLHDFITIDGKRKFKFVAQVPTWEFSHSPDGTGFYEVKMTDKQLALVDIKTNKPIKLPNGSCWVECVKYASQRTHYSQQVYTDFIPSKVGCIEMIYDSSSGEEYFYDIATKSFINPENGVDFINYDKIRIGNLENPFGMYEICYYAKETYVPTTVIPYYQGKPVIIPLNGVVQGGYSLLKEISYCGKNIFELKTLSREYYLWDWQENKIYNLPVPSDEIYQCRNSIHSDTNRYVMYRINTFNEKNRKYEIATYGSYNHRDVNIIFSLETKQWLRNPIDNSIYFDMYSENSTSGRLTLYNRNYRENNLEPKLDFKLSDDGSKFVLEEAKKSITLTESDLKQIVKNTIKKLLQ